MAALPEWHEHDAILFGGYVEEVGAILFGGRSMLWVPSPGDAILFGTSTTPSCLAVEACLKCMHRNLLGGMEELLEWHGQAFSMHAL